MRRAVHWFSRRIVVMLLLILLFVTTPPLTNAQGFGDVIINEFLADPPSDISGDANRDGVRDSYDDEFVEIVNMSGTAVDISGWTFSTFSTIRHTFPANTVLPNGCGIVIFGGGTPTGNFGDCIVQVASSGRLGLINLGETITLNHGVVIIDTYTYNDEGANDQSLTRQPELISGAPFDLHSIALGSGGSIFSPGTKVDGSLFSSGCPGNKPSVYLPLVIK